MKQKTMGAEARHKLEEYLAQNIGEYIQIKYRGFGGTKRIVGKVETIKSYHIREDGTCFGFWDFPPASELHNFRTKPIAVSIKQRVTRTTIESIDLDKIVAYKNCTVSEEEIETELWKEKIDKPQSRQNLVNIVLWLGMMVLLHFSPHISPYSTSLIEARAREARIISFYQENGSCPHDATPAYLDLRVELWQKKVEQGNSYK